MKILSNTQLPPLRREAMVWSVIKLRLTTTEAARVCGVCAKIVAR